MPKQNPAARWNRTQLAEKLHAIGKDLRTLAADIKRPQANAAAISSWHREVASYVHDMSALLAGEIPHSDRVMHKAEELRGASDILVQWADSPTDDTGNKARAAQLTGIAEAIDAFADKLL